MAKLANSMPHVAILLESTYATHTQILRGILRFTQLHTPWTLDVRTGRAGEPTSFGAEKWKVDGIIANRLPPELSALIRRHRTPTIVMNDIGREVRPIARILCDNAAIARLAAETLAGKGFENFAFVGERSGIHWSVARERVFADEIARRGFPCRVYPTDEGGGAEDGRRLQDWLRALPRPTALFAAYDIRARQVLDACHAAGLAVPDDIAILGVDDDEVICETATPALSSIPLSMADAGRRVPRGRAAGPRHVDRAASARRGRHHLHRHACRGAPLDRARHGGGRARAPVPRADGGERGPSLQRGRPGRQPRRVAPHAGDAVPRGDRPFAQRRDHGTPHPPRQDDAREVGVAPAREVGVAPIGHRGGLRLLRREPPQRDLPPPLRRTPLGLPREQVMRTAMERRPYHAVAQERDPPGVLGRWRA